MPGTRDPSSSLSFANRFVTVVVGLSSNRMVALREFGTLRPSPAVLGIARLREIVTNHAIVLFEDAKRAIAAGKGRS